MIGTYLSQLYSNCKVLAKSPDFDGMECCSWFNECIELIVKKLHLKSEEELVSLLVSGKLSYVHLPSLLQVFYLVNSVGEYANDASSYDELGRFKYTSLTDDLPGVMENKVLELMLRTVNEHVFLRKCFTVTPHKSYFFLSHDIDSLYGSTLQDGLWAVKHFRLDVMLKILANAMFTQPHWFNIDLIMKMESEYDFRSTFYWLVNSGKIDARQTNSDYSIHSDKIQNTLKTIRDQGFEIGLHKSISNETFVEELKKLPLPVTGNRYHYLKFQLPAAYEAIEASGLKLDASLGFAEHYGFRNNYAYPFSPYNFKTKTAYSFLEVPLTIMDGTFQRYLRIPVQQTADRVTGFFEQHKQNSVLSVLWHNTFFTDYKYKGYKEEYKKILSYLYEQKWNAINQTQLIDTFGWKK